MSAHVSVLRSIVIVVVLALPIGAMGQPPVTRLTRDEAVVLALRENPSLRAKAFEVRATQANEVTAALRPNPTASYSAEQLGGRTTDAQYTVTVGQTVETGGKRGKRIASARAGTRVAGYELDDVRRQVIAQVKKAFTDVLVAQATLVLAQDNLKTLDEIERVQRFRAERGDISELELLRIQIQRFTFERDAADARLAMAAAKIALRQAAGPLVIAADVEVVGDLDFRELRPVREELYRAALANRPDLRAAEAARARARADNELARANAWWDVTPEVQYRRIAEDNMIGVGISIPLRIFDRNQGEIARTRAEIDRADALRESARAQVEADVDIALSALTIQRDRVSLLRDTYLPKAQQARDTVDFAYRRGGVSLLDFLDAQRTYRETAVEHLRALGNYWAAVYQLEAAVGGVMEK
jgi:cobalt-zinc-cadmium efflux system outer membrane protein